MKLVSAKIENFKCIDDSKEFSISDVTSLVGKNESGKSTILQALYKLNPVEIESKFDILDYPRRKVSEYEERLELKKDEPDNVVTSIWELSEDDIKVLIDKFGEGVLKDGKVTIKKGYENKVSCIINYDEKKIVQWYLVNNTIDKANHSHLFKLNSVKELVEEIAKIVEPDEQVVSLKSKLGSEIGNEPFDTIISNVLLKRLPKFLYFSDYYKLSGQVSIEKLKADKSANRLSISDKVFIALLSLASSTPEQIDSTTEFERLQSKLESVSSRLSSEIFTYWTQNKHLKVLFRYDAARINDPAPFNSGFVFRTRIENTRHSVTVNFDERSTGFVWFFSFLIWFSQIKKTYGENLIVLLDEPGLNLHAKAQGDLLRYFDEKLKPFHQVVYTTHSPFMINPEKLMDVRTVEDVTKNDVILGTKVSEDALNTDAETLFPLQAALGYDITQTLFIGKDTLLVEGPSDLLYIKYFSNLLKENGQEYLNSNWTITPVGGIDKIGGFISLFGANSINVAVLTDFQKGHKGKIRALKESEILKKGHFFSAEMFANQDEADIEDIIGREFYINLVNECYGLSKKNELPTNKVKNAPVRVIDEVEKHFAVLPPDAPEFDHFSPSLFLLENSAKFKKGATGIDVALNNFEKIFKEINALKLKE